MNQTKTNNDKGNGGSSITVTGVLKGVAFHGAQGLAVVGLTFAGFALSGLLFANPWIVVAGAGVFVAITLLGLYYLNERFGIADWFFGLFSRKDKAATSSK